MEKITAKTPWAEHLGDVPLHIDYFEGSMFEALEATAIKYPHNIAFDFMGKSTTYANLIEQIKKCAKAQKTLVVRVGERVTIAMPNCPQAIYLFFAVCSVKRRYIIPQHRAICPKAADSSPPYGETSSGLTMKAIR